MRAFLKDLIAGPGGTVDEAALCFLLGQITAIIGAFLDTCLVGRFPFGEFAAFEAAYIPLYHIAVGIRGCIGKGN